MVTGTDNLVCYLTSNKTSDTPYAAALLQLTSCRPCITHCTADTIADLTTREHLDTASSSPVTWPSDAAHQQQVTPVPEAAAPDHNRPSRRQEPTQNGKVTVRVNKISDPTLVANKIVSVMDSSPDDAVAVSALFPHGCATAIKSIIRARNSLLLDRRSSLHFEPMTGRKISTSQNAAESAPATAEEPSASPAAAAADNQMVFWFNVKKDDHVSFDDKKDAECLYVGRSSRVVSLAGGITGKILEHGYATLIPRSEQTLPNGLLALVLARGMLAEHDADIYVLPENREEKKSSGQTQVLTVFHLVKCAARPGAKEAALAKKQQRMLNSNSQQQSSQQQSSQQQSPQQQSSQQQPSQQQQQEHDAGLVSVPVEEFNNMKQQLEQMTKQQEQLLQLLLQQQQQQGSSSDDHAMAASSEGNAAAHEVALHAAADMAQGHVPTAADVIDML
eukprot:jgi/Chrzof1/12565/UNPLg00518.t1